MQVRTSIVNKKRPEFHKLIDRCDGSLCKYEKQKEECDTISECVSIGKCSSDKPCYCSNNYCTKPWWIQHDNENLNCRNEKVR